MITLAIIFVVLTLAGICGWAYYQHLRQTRKEEQRYQRRISQDSYYRPVTVSPVVIPTEVAAAPVVEPEVEEEEITLPNIRSTVTRYTPPAYSYTPPTPTPAPAPRSSSKQKPRRSSSSSSSYSSSSSSSFDWGSSSSSSGSSDFGGGSSGGGGSNSDW